MFVINRDYISSKIINITDFNLENIYSIIIWAIKNANQYIDNQLVDLFYELTSEKNIKNYKSNQKTWENQDWRWNNMKSKLVNDALSMALFQRKPKKGLIWYSDRGSQYASESHRTILKDHGIIQSMSRKGNCWDNAVAESFFHTLKTELTNHHQFENQQEVKNIIFEYIEVFYNRIRIHYANNYLAPVEFEKRNRFLKKSLKSV